MLHLYRACQRLRRRLAEDLFLAEDLRAHARGWTVVPIDNGTGRRYRDPRFDCLLECTGCRGAGFLGIDTCPICAGRGVVDTRRATTAPTTVVDEHTDRRIRVVAERLDHRVALPPGQEDER